MKVDQFLQNAMQSSSKEELDAIFSEIFNQYFKLVYFVAVQYVKNDADAEDVTQETFLKFFNKLAGNEFNKPIKSTKAYLCTLAKNNALDLLKNKDYQNVEFDNNINGSDDQYTFFDDSFIKLWNETLAKDEQEILINKIIFELRFKDIAKALSINTNTVKTKYTRALKKIRERMKDYE